jgi:hypothetical protein
MPIKRSSDIEHGLFIDVVGYSRRSPVRATLPLLCCTLCLALTAAASELIGEDDHPPEIRQFFSGTVQHIDGGTLIVSRGNERHTFLLRSDGDAHPLKVPANALHRPVEVIYTGNRDPYRAVKVQVLASLPKPTPKEEKTPTYYRTGTTQGVDEDHLVIQSGLARHIFIINALTMYYDRERYIIVDPHPQADFRRSKRVKVGYTGRTEPFRAVSVELLK